MKKKRVGVFFGGQSPEHEISLRSARFIIDSINTDFYEIFPIGISTQGLFYLFSEKQIPAEIQRLDSKQDDKGIEVTLTRDDKGPYLCSTSSQEDLRQRLDLAFPVLHGPMGEDGVIQGLFRLCSLPYVGCGVLSSAITMDKDITKKILQQHGIATVPYRLLRKEIANPSFTELTKELGEILFLKPANMGSSVGVHRVRDSEAFQKGLQDAFRFDNKVLAEQAIDGQEIECSVLGQGSQISASVLGRIRASHEFYSYEAKYLDQKGAEFEIPAQLDQALTKRIREIAVASFRCLECEGLARVDFFVRDQEIFVNELNTMPGFTSISLYPRLWQESGLNSPALVQRLLDMAENRLSP